MSVYKLIILRQMFETIFELSNKRRKKWFENFLIKMRKIYQVQMIHNFKKFNNTSQTIQF